MRIPVRNHLAPATPVRPAASLRSLRRQEALAAYLFLAPTLLGFLVFIAGPLVAGLSLSFMHYDILTPPRFAGLDNFAEILRDRRVPVIYRNTAILMLIGVPLNLVVALAIALGLNRALPRMLKYLFRTAYFFPTLTSSAVMAIIWSFLLNQDLGAVNYYLGLLGTEKIPWTSSSAWAIPSIILVGLWRGLGFDMMVLLAGLQNIPEHLYEAAKIDGAGSWALFRHITLPMLSPTLFFVLIIGLIGGFQIFETPYVLTEGGPGDASRTVVMYIFYQGFRAFNMGYASALAVSLFVIILLLTLLQFRVGRSWVHYR